MNCLKTIGYALIATTLLAFGYSNRNNAANLQDADNFNSDERKLQPLIVTQNQPMTVAQNQGIDWSGLPGQDKIAGPDVEDFIVWMTPEREAYFSQFRHPSCPDYILQKDYGHSLAVCNAFNVHHDQWMAGMNRRLGNLDRILDCQRRGYRFCL